MFEAFNIAATPASTEASPQIQIVTLPVGTITHVGIQFPRGCDGLVRVRIIKAAVQVWPRTEQYDVRSDNTIIGWDDDYPVIAGDQRFSLRVVNTDQVFTHTISVFFSIAAPPAPPDSAPDPGLMSRLLSRLG